MIDCNECLLIKSGVSYAISIRIFPLNSPENTIVNPARRLLELIDYIFYVLVLLLFEVLAVVDGAADLLAGLFYAAGRELVPLERSEFFFSYSSYC